MKYSVRIKLFAAMSGMIVFFMAVSWVFNNFFLEKYYLYSKEKSLKDIYVTIDRLFINNEDSLELEIEKMGSLKGVSIIIFDRDFNIVYDSFQREMNFRSRGISRVLNNQNPAVGFIKERLKQLAKGNPIVMRGNDKRLNSNFINLYSKLGEKDYIYLSTPVAAIQENVKTANKFFMFTGLITLCAGSVLIFSISSKFTRPILELNEIARRMAVLDFSRRYRVKSRDEMGTLGESINSMSEQLEKSISELRAANEKLKMDIQRERKIDEMRKEFISNVSHELKTPIALIQGYAEGLKVNVNEDEENKNFYCDVITDEALKMNRLVRNLLDLSQLESGVTDLEKGDFDISQLVEDVLKKNTLIFREKGIDVAFENNASVFVCADYDRTEQVFVNYINNAVNHTDEKKTINVTITKSGSKVRVTVFNSGRHIPEESLDRIWDSFYKVEKARTRSYGGTGLGLSIVKAIQEAHCNAFGAENVRDGVEFWFEADISSQAA